MQPLKTTKLITAILRKGSSLRVVEKIRQDKRLITANFNYVCGLGKLTPAKYRGVGEQSVKEILTVVVEAARADEIFEYIYHLTNINRPHGGSSTCRN